VSTLDWKPIIDPFGKPAWLAQTDDGFYAIVAEELAWMAAATPEQARSRDPADTRMTAYGVIHHGVVRAQNFAENVPAAKAMAETLVAGMRSASKGGTHG
jgi:hypothetical protein